ncbi:laccase domain-containing protein [bacterium]|nr:laccase domain-containing protein [bacterium]
MSYHKNAPIENNCYDKLIFFNNFFSSEITTGITLKGMGDLSTINGKKKIRELKDFLQTDYFFLPTPQHENYCWHVEPNDTIINLKECDAIFLKRKNFPKNKVATIGFTTGDCPILIGTDEENSFVIHSGIYGSKINISGNLLWKLNINKQIDIKKIKITIWGGICPKCYEVGQEWEDTFPGYVKNGFLNLRGVIMEQIIEAGINIENISLASNMCSHESPDLFSHRGGDKERNLVFIRTLI